jgi:3-oxoacyl-[acyl-carrier-protein] synthase II
MRRRVVVTGVGLVTPLGGDVDSNWEALLAGRSGLAPVTRFDTSTLPCRIAAEVRDLHPGRWVSPLDEQRVDRFIVFALAAAEEAARRAHLAVSDALAERVGVVLGVGLGGLPGIEANHRALTDAGPRRVSPFFIPAVIANLAPGHIAMRLGARGPNLTTATACASGAHAVGEAFEMVAAGRADVVVTGGAEAAITPLSLAGFGVMRALSTWDGPPAGASRPFDRRRSGFVMGEGAGILVLEALEVAREREAPILAEVLGYGASADAFHITQPRADGAGAAQAIRHALARAGLPPEAVAHVNAHGTGTKQGDVAEVRALEVVFGDRARAIPVSATKSMTGHLLGAAGAVEAIYTVLALQNQTLPPTINLDDPDPECALDHVVRGPRRASVDVALSNSFGFGGTNAALLFGAAPPAGSALR